MEAKVAMGMNRSAFSIIELLVVIAIIAAIGAVAFPIMARQRAEGERTASLALVRAVAAAIDGYTPKIITVNQGTTPVLRRMWCVGETSSAGSTSGEMDGDATKGWVAPNGTMPPAWYRGPAGMLGVELPAWAIDSQGRIQDRWKRPLRIAWAAGGVYGQAGFGVWSCGPDGVSDPTSAASDDLKSW